MSVMSWDRAYPDAAMAAYDLSPVPDPHELELAHFLERASLYYLNQLQRSIPTDHPCRNEEYPLSRLFSFTKHIESRINNGQLPFWKDEWFKDTRETIALASKSFEHVVDYRLLKRIGENLHNIVNGKTTAIELTMNDDLLNDFYPVALGMAHHTKYLARTVKQITYRFPHMNILEVGAGTGGATKVVLDILGDSLSSYTFTDISAGFFLKAQEYFRSFTSSSRILYKVLDISRDPQQQGFTEHSYDLIIASQVLHATPPMRQSLLNARRLLKSGGFLVVNEGVNNDTARLGTIFGAFPGWWLGAENDGRSLGPNLAVADWDKLLRETGFSGCDSQVPIVDALLTPNTVFVSQAVDPRVSFLRSPLSISPQALSSLNTVNETAPMAELIIIGGEPSSPVSNIAHELKLLLEDYFGKSTHIHMLADVAAENVPISSRATIVGLSDLDDPMFRQLTEAKLQAMKRILHQAVSVLWVTQGRRAQDPFANMTVGLVRAALLEIPTLEFQFLDFEDASAIKARTIAEFLLRFKFESVWVPRRSSNKNGSHPLLTTVEREYVIDKDGQVLIPRIMPNKEMNDRYNSARRPIYKSVVIDDRNTDHVKIHGHRVRIDMQNNEYYLEEAEHGATSETLQPIHSLLLACRIRGLGFGHISLTRDVKSTQVTLSSQLSSPIQPVCSLWGKILSSQEEALLGDSATKARFLRLVKLNILATETVSHLSSNDRLILLEPDLAFANLVKREATIKNINVTVISSRLEKKRCDFLGWSKIHPEAPARSFGELLPKKASSFLVCDGGQPSDITDIAARIIQHLPSGCKVTYLTQVHATKAWVEPNETDGPAHDVHDQLHAAVQHALEDLHRLSVEGTVIRVDNLSKAVPTVDTSEGLIHDQTVIEWEGVKSVPVKIRPVDSQTLFSNSKTYWLAGLTGSLGLSLCEWMISRGAKYIVMTSRKPNVSHTWRDRMASLGGVVKIDSNDLTDLEQTRALCQDIYSAMPPIGGIVSAAMVLVDTTLDNMTLEEMHKVCHPKVQGTINLDKLFFNVDLDFFVAFSSIVAVTGNPGQSNYAAANMFMTSLMEQRRSRGLAASVMHIAPILGVGYVTEKSDRTKTNFPRTSGYSLTAEQDFHQVFAEAVVAGRKGTESTGNTEIVMGLHKVNPNPEKLPYWYDNPIATHFIYNTDAMNVSKPSTERASVKSQLSAATNSAQVAQILTDAMKPFVCSLFQVQGSADLSDAQFLDLTLDRIGLDSLLAVEIRTWLLKTVNVNVPVMKILSGLSIRQLIFLTVDSLPAILTPNVSSSDSNSSPQPDAPLLLYSESLNGIKSSDVSDHSSSNATDTDLSSSPASFNTEISVMPVSKNLDRAKEASHSLEQASSTSKTREIAIEKWMELSYSQTMFWFVLKFLNSMAGLNHTGLFRMTGPLRIADLKRAVVQLGNRHEVLRTCFKAFDDRPQQGIMEASRLRLEHRRISSEEQVMSVFEELQSYAYDLELGECLRIVLLELSPNTHFLLEGTHSLVLDGISGSILIQDLLRLYENETSIADSASIYQYSTFAENQRKAFEDGKLKDSLSFWKEQLSPSPPPLPVLRISTATTRPVYTKYQNQRVDLIVDSATKSRIREICRHCKIRPFHFFLTAFRALLSRYADAEEVCIGIADANRSHEGAMEGLGPYINLLPLRFSNSLSQRFEAELQETKSKADSALAHSDVPFQLLLNELGVSRSATHAPIFQTFFDYRQGMRKRQSWGECDLELLSFQASKLPYDLSFDIIDDSGSNTCHLMLIARGDIYSKEDVEMLLGSLQKMIHAFIDTPDTSFADPNIFDSGKVEKALQFGTGDTVRSQWPYESIVGRIHAMANSTPNEVALKMAFGGKSMTYKEMLNKSQSICAALCAKGCTAGSKVAVYQEPTPDWLCSVLGVLGAGAVCVPFDAGTLIKRLEDMADDSKVAFILIDSKIEDQAIQQLVANGVRKIINVEHVSDDHPMAGPFISPSADDPAMVLYTSGSTGSPKGIVLKHIGFRNWAEFVPPLFRSGERDVVLQQSSSGFDMAYLQAFFALCYGGTVCIVPREMRVDARAIADIIASESVTVTCGVPSEYTSWLQYGSRQSLSRATNWRTAMCGGEPGTNIVLELQATLGPQPPPRFFHMYGPTEITFITTAMELLYGSGEKTPAVGTPFPNYSVYVLDEQLRPVPPGIQGEIYVGGAGVAAGYLANEGMTAEKFVPDRHASPSFKSLGWTTMHRTGDNGRWRQDGSLLIEGRRSGDTQHKLRGLRIDLQEVENVMIKEANGILSDVVVSVVRTSPLSPELLVAHVKFYPHYRPSEADQQRVLNQLSSNLALPQYMRPAVTVAVEELPKMSSGKLDRRAVASLPLPDLPQLYATDDDVDAKNFTQTEVRLKKLWQDVISKDVTKLYRINAHTDFFHAGGTSMLLLRLQSRIQQHFGLEIPFAQMFEGSTLGSMAKRIEKGNESSMEQFDWNAETAILESTVSALTHATSHILSPPRVVVLTGATGLVGQGILQALIEDQNVDKIHCIAIRNVRARIASLPLLNHRKVILHEGELSLPLLGLDDVKAKAIFQDADRIIHNGADTSHLKTYQSLRAANTISTQEIVTMCLLAKKRIPISYISTASILQYSGLDAFSEESAAQYPPPPHAFDGYSASKWASERYLERLHEQSYRTWPICIHRLTSVQRRARSTESNSDSSPSPSSNAALEVVGNLLQYCKLANAVPFSSNLRGVMNLTWLDDVVTSVMSAIHAPLHNGCGESPLRYLHDHGEMNISFSNIKAYVDAETGRDTQVLPLEEWVKRAAELGLDPMLVAYFEMVGRMPLVVWPRLVKK